MSIDPLLTSKLNTALSEEKFKIVVTFATQFADKRESTQTRNNVEKILHETEIPSDEKPVNVTYLPKLGVLMLEATTRFIHKLIENPLISSAALVSDQDVYKI